jgi:hypothetical protein
MFGKLLVGLLGLGLVVGACAEPECEIEGTVLVAQGTVVRNETLILSSGASITVYPSYYVRVYKIVKVVDSTRSDSVSRDSTSDSTKGHDHGRRVHGRFGRGHKRSH